MANLPATTANIQLVTQLADRLGIPPSDDLLAVLKATAFKGQVSDAQMTALLVVANQYGLNPWTKEIYAFPDQNNGIVPVVGVDGWSRIINTHAQFDGVEFKQDDESCTCIIYRKDRAHPISITEYLSECKRDVKPWKTHPKRMLRHKSLIQCARIAFGYTGIYDEDEADRILEKDVTPRVYASQTAADALSPPPRNEFHEQLITDLEQVAKTKGDKPFQDAWKGLSSDDKAAIGIEERNRIRALAVVYSQTEPDPAIADDFLVEFGEEAGPEVIEE